MRSEPQPNSVINPATDDLGTLGGANSEAYNINDSGQVVGRAATSKDAAVHAFRTSPNSPINPATDDLGTLGGTSSRANHINNLGQVVGSSSTAGNAATHPMWNRESGPDSDTEGTSKKQISSRRASVQLRYTKGGMSTAGEFCRVPCHQPAILPCDDHVLAGLKPLNAVLLMRL